MSTDVDTATTTRAEHRDRTFLAVVLLTAGGMLLTDRLVPGWPLGDAVALVIGLELLVWAVSARAAGPLVGGGIAIGVGTGILLVNGPLQGHDATEVGGAWLLALGVGFVLVAGGARLLRVERQDWAWIPAVCLVGLGAAIGLGISTTVIAWAGPLVLLGIGAWLLLRRRR
ncbi:hypothetical protein [Geodermatophilus amargosae]|uniref:hypothetical protein n=1 Tax=Geodermatophilus amargosae TaxID=1296565 RepID=UPI0034DEADA0